MHNSCSFVWYAGYGSNLSKQRFLCYIVGGKPKYGKKHNDGCSNKNPRVEDKPYRIPYRLYFALPEGKTETGMWGPGGVAFLNSEREENGEAWTWGRIWKITKEQYEKVRDQEGRSWYNFQIQLGEENEIPIYTITSKENLTNIMPPSKAY